MLLQSRFRTRRKEEADLFFVPSYVKCVRMMGGLNDKEINQTYVKVVMSQNLKSGCNLLTRQTLVWYWWFLNYYNFLLWMEIYWPWISLGIVISAFHFSDVKCDFVFLIFLWHLLLSGIKSNAIFQVIWRP